MITGTLISSIVMALEFVVLLYIFLYSLRLKRIHTVTRVLYLLWSATLFTSNLYYLTHLLQNKGLYLPFSAMDIVDMGIYTLLGAVLQNNFSINIKKLTWPSVEGALFGALNVWLWILWSGKLLGNLINALPFIYLLFMCGRSLEESRSLEIVERLCFASATMVVAVLESVLYFTQGTVYMVLDVLCYILLFSCDLFLIFKTVDVLRNGNADRAIALAATTYTMGLVTQYLSYEPVYFVAEVLVVFSLALICLAVGKKEKEAEKE